jgi:hypothetical protein
MQVPIQSTLTYENLTHDTRIWPIFEPANLSNTRTKHYLCTRFDGGIACLIHKVIHDLWT